MAYIPKQLAVWIKAFPYCNQPVDGEKILFHCKGWEKNQWQVGTYCDKKNEVYVEISRNIYKAYYWDVDVDYWMRVPAL